VAANAQTLSSSQNMEFKAIVNRMTSLVPGATLTPPSAAALTSGSPTASSTSTGPTRPVPRQPGTVCSVRGMVRGMADMGVQAVRDSAMGALGLVMVTMVGRVDPGMEDQDLTVDLDQDPTAVTLAAQVDPDTGDSVVQVDPDTEDSEVQVDPDTGDPDSTVDPDTEDPDSTVDLDMGALGLITVTQVDQVDPGTEDSIVDLDMALDPAGTEGLDSAVVTQLEMVVQAS